jgi:hypothetical protein
MRTLLLIVALLVPLPALAEATCPSTASSNHSSFIPPAPFAAVLERERFWYGSEKLWISLREDGRWGGVYRPDLKVYRNKLPLYRTGFDWRRYSNPPLTVTARRINQPSTVGAIMADPPHGVSDGQTSFIMTGLDLPAGCWQIESRFANESPLTFVVTVP